MNFLHQMLASVEGQKEKKRFVLPILQAVLYSEAQLGLGTSSPIAFGTQPLSNYTYEGHSTIPTPFPLMFETTPKIGIALFAWDFVGIEAAFGYRILWVVHPLVSISKDRVQEGMKKDTRGAVVYDLTSPFIQIGAKIAF